MLGFSDLRAGTKFVLDGDPYEVLEYNFLRMQQRKPVAQTKIRNLRSGKVLNKTFHQNESFQEAEIEPVKAVFLYGHRNEYWFAKNGNLKDRFNLPDEIIGDAIPYLRQNTEITVNYFKDKPLSLSIPIKIDLKVTESAPGIKGDTAQGGTKEVLLETGLKVQVPLFINEGDTVRINTQNGEYVERANKG